MIEILPSIIPNDFEDLREHVESVSHYASIVHLDVCDGLAVPRKSWPYMNDEGEFERILNQDEGLPQWENVDYEVHLMVANPMKDIEDWIAAGTKRIVVQLETIDTPQDIISLLQEKYGYDKNPEYSLIELGFAIKLDTPNDALASVASDIHFVQCMGINRVGFGGEKVDPLVFEKIKSLKATYPQLIISGDGGVTHDNAHEWVEAGATRLVSGSAIFESENIAEAIKELRAVDKK